MAATRSLCLTLVATAAILTLAAPAQAQHYVALETPGMPGSCEIIPSWGFVDVAVVHYAGGAGATGSQFAVPMPACFSGSASWLGDAWSLPGVFGIGNSQDGVTLAYGQCLTGTIVLGVVQFSVPDLPPQCCDMEITAHPSAASGQIEALDCAGGTISLLNSIGGVFNAGGTSCMSMDPPHTPDPADGATDVALNTMFTWTPGETRNPCFVLAYPYGIFSMGIHPDSLQDVGWDIWSSFDPGILEQSTTYYWQVVYGFGEDGATGPVWEFTTTASALPVEATTWGRLKALYE